MKYCVGCRRHLKVAEVRCPFCGAAQRELRPAPAGRWALAVTLAMVGCTDRTLGGGDGTAGESGEASTTTGPSTTSNTTTSTSTTTTTGPISTVSTVSGATDADSSTTDAPGTSFVVYGAGDGGPIAIECSLADQDCPDGEKCMPWANDGGNEWNATRCAPLAPDAGALGEPCSFEGSQWSGVDDCEMGAICLGNGLEDAGRCVELCGSGCDTPGTFCAVESVLEVCLVTCDPFAELAPCAADEVCIGIAGGAYCMPGLPPLGGYGEECHGVNNCESSHICSASALPMCAGDTCCTAFCDITQPDTCPEAAAGIVCTDAGYPAPFENVGICQQ